MKCKLAVVSLSRFLRLDFVCVNSVSELFQFSENPDELCFRSGHPSEGAKGPEAREVSED